VLPASLGGAIEFYDFVIFGIFAKDIADALSFGALASTRHRRSSWRGADCSRWSGAAAGRRPRPESAMKTNVLRDRVSLLVT
jgi:hypothetical protein